MVKRDVTLWLKVYLELEPTSKHESISEKGEIQEPKKLYKWTDHQGRIHITDSPPSGSDRP